MAEPLDQRPIRSRKPKVHFDDKIALPLGSKKPTKSTKPAKSTKPPAPPALASALAERIELDGAIDELCGQAEELDIEDDPKAKKKAKAAEIARLTTLNI